MIKAIVFDIDDTLYSYKDANAAAMEAICTYAWEQLGIPHQEFEEAYVLEMRALREELHPSPAQHTRCIRFLRILQERGLPLAHASHLEDLYWNTLIAASVPEPGLTNCLQALHSQGYILGVGSNMTLQWQLKKLEHLGLLPYFSFVVASEEVGANKPDLRLFQLCARRAHVKPESCLFVGDNLDHDVRGARAAGMKSLWYVPGQKKPADHPCFSHYSQLPALVQVLDML